jgi:hypothetical protein
MHTQPQQVHIPVINCGVQLIKHFIYRIPTPAVQHYSSCSAHEARYITLARISMGLFFKYFD